MSFNVTSKNPQANAHLNLGVDGLRRYQERPENLAILHEAEEDLNRALQEDPSLLPAVYYRGLARELKGESDLAISDLTRVIESNPSFKAEATFNLGVARYHKYHRVDLEQAKTQFRSVLDSKITKQLRLQALASLAQVHAQLMIQKDPEQPDLDEIKSNYMEVLHLRDEITSLLNGHTPEPEIQWRIENALGLGNMFASDYYAFVKPEDSQTVSRPMMIGEARDRFEKADKISPNNWAILCNLGSIWMRISYWRDLRELEPDSVNSFDQSQYFLRLVVDKIRPGYGFALYELGRLYRINELYSEALEWFKRAEAISESKRDVSTATLHREIKRAATRNPVFP